MLPTREYTLHPVRVRRWGHMQTVWQMDRNGVPWCSVLDSADFENLYRQDAASLYSNWVDADGTRHAVLYSAAPN